MQKRKIKQENGLRDGGCMWDGVFEEGLLGRQHVTGAGQGQKQGECPDAMTPIQEKGGSGFRWNGSHEGGKDTLVWEWWGLECSERL